jgi:hypothetical protein
MMNAAFHREVVKISTFIRHEYLREGPMPYYLDLISYHAAGTILCQCLLVI